MFEWLKEQKQQIEQEERTERERLMALSEKQLMVEILIELKRIGRKCDHIARNI